MGKPVLPEKSVIRVDKTTGHPSNDDFSLVEFQLKSTDQAKIGFPVPSSTKVLNGVNCHNRNQEDEDSDELPDLETEEKDESDFEDGLHCLFKPTTKLISNLINHPKTMTKARQMFRSDKSVDEREMVQHGWIYYVFSATVPNVRYKCEVKWPEIHDNLWEEKMKFTCTCPVKGICKHVGVMLLHLGK